MQFSHRIASIDNVQSAPSPPPLAFCLSLSTIPSAAHPRLRLATRHSQPLLVLSTLATRYQMLFISFSRFRRRRRRRVLLSLPLRLLFLMHILHAVPHNEDSLSPPLLPFPLPAQLMPHFTSDADCVQMIAKYGNNLYAVLPPATPMCPHTQRVATLEHPTICYLPLYGLLLIIIKELGGWMRRPNEPEEVRK